MNNRIVKYFAVLIFSLSIYPAICLQAQETVITGEPQIVDTCGKGMLLDIAGQRVLIVSGNHYQMGYQQGKLLKNEVQTLVARVLDIVQVAENTGMKGFTHGSIINAYERTNGFIDERFKEEMRGLADGAQMELKDVQLANIFPELFHCSGFALFGNSTMQGRLLHGRILDYMTEVGLQDYALVTIAQPEGYNSFVNVGYAGFLGSVTGMNTQQIAIGQMGGAGQGDWDGVPMTYLIRKVIEEASTLDQAVAIFRDNPRTCKYYYVISDAKIPDARALACTPTVFEVVEPGEHHEKLPLPLNDTVMVSAKERYENLSRLVGERYGEIDIAYALRLMNKPVAMNSCLHQVLFEPQGQNFWVSNAASIEETENYAAFHQPYYKYNLTALITFAQEQGLDNDLLPVKAKPQEDKDTQKPLEIALLPLEGVVGSDIIRPLPASDNPKQQELINQFKTEQAEFEYKLTHLTGAGRYNIYQAQFPTAYKSPHAENNTIYCEYYDVIGEHKRPAVIILDILNGSMVVSRTLANSFANNGVNAAIMTLPYYGKRLPEGFDNRNLIATDIDFFINSIRNAVMDVRTTARWLSSLDNVEADKIGICGTSLGGFVAALSAGVDGNFYKAAFILAGGDLAAVLSSNEKETRFIAGKIAENGISDEKLIEILTPIEPLTYADRLKNTDILMVNGSQDKVVPPICAEKLALAADIDVVWHPADHYSIIKYILPIIGSINKHFEEIETKN